jgi:hypothetical protein
MVKLTSEDVFAEWKTRRFVVADNVYAESKNIILILTDMAYWTGHYEELREWCQAHQCQTVGNPSWALMGMTVELPDEAALTLFTLRWS